MQRSANIGCLPLSDWHEHGPPCPALWWRQLFIVTAASSSAGEFSHARACQNTLVAAGSLDQEPRTWKLPGAGRAKYSCRRLKDPGVIPCNKSFLCTSRSEFGAVWSALQVNAPVLERGIRVGWHAGKDPLKSAFVPNWIYTYLVHWTQKDLQVISIATNFKRHSEISSNCFLLYFIFFIILFFIIFFYKSWCRLTCENKLYLYLPWDMVIIKECGNKDYLRKKTQLYTHMPVCLCISISLYLSI